MKQIEGYHRSAIFLDELKGNSDAFLLCGFLGLLTIVMSAMTACASHGWQIVMGFFGVTAILIGSFLDRCSSHREQLCRPILEPAEAEEAAGLLRSPAAI